MVSSCLRRHLTHNASPPSLVVGFSGGRDSVALLFALKQLQSEFGYRLGACHVNHGLSPHAMEWQVFCRHFCDDLQVPLEIVAVDVPLSSGEGLEAAARGRRYAVFERMDADWLILGQHRGDQAETLLFNLVRGAGLQGAAAMPESRSVRSGMSLMRPLLGLARSDIGAYLHNRSLTWVDDESNCDIRFSRNFLRHRVLPELQARFPAAEGNLAAAASRFAEAHALLDELAELDLAGESASFPFPVTGLSRLSEPRGRNLLRFLLTQHGVRIPAETRLREILRQLLQARSDRHPAVIFGDWRIFRKRGAVLLEKILGDEA